VLRAAFIVAGAAVLSRFHGALYFFGALLILTGVKLLRTGSAADSSEKPKLLSWLENHLPLTTFKGESFIVSENGRRYGTPLLLALIAIEITDVVFAVDSIPAVFAVTSDPFIVFTSNIFAILGLRSLYFLLSGVIHRFVYLKVGLAAVLVFVGAKMLLVDYVKVPILVSLGVICSALLLSIVLSLRRSMGTKAEKAEEETDETAFAAEGRPSLAPREARGRT
jgi:tellurite resistance protein TerC